MYERDTITNFRKHFDAYLGLISYKYCPILSEILRPIISFSERFSAQKSGLSTDNFQQIGKNFNLEMSYFLIPEMHYYLLIVSSMYVFGRQFPSKSISWFRSLYKLHRLQVTTFFRICVVFQRKIILTL